MQPALRLIRAPWRSSGHALRPIEQGIARQMLERGLNILLPFCYPTSWYGAVLSLTEVRASRRISVIFHTGWNAVSPRNTTIAELQNRGLGVRSPSTPATV